ncbi:MAG: hypothetical protein QW703_00440 [Candidatus Aenigmatarchaeota archaeon]
MQVAKKLSTEEFRNIVSFEKITKNHPIDCITKDECVYFLVDGKKIGTITGKNGMNIKTLSKIINRPVQIIGIEKDVEKTIKGMIPYVKQLEMDKNVITAYVEYPVSGKRAQIAKEIVEKYFNAELKLIRY